MARELEIVWTGPLRGIAKPMTRSFLDGIARSIALLYTFSVIASIPIGARWIEVEGVDVGSVRVVMALSVAAALFLAFGAPRLPMRVFPSLAPWIFTGVFAASGSLIALAIVAGGANFGVFAVYLVEAPLFAFFLLHLRWAIFFTGTQLFAYAVALSLLDDPPAPLAQWLQVLAAAVGTAVIVGRIAKRLDDLNQNLEHRVAEQVEELERTGRLRRFLSPQVADVVTAADADDLLQPHRSDVAVFFVDLRGFSQFANHATAEEVVRVLTEYYEVVGEILQRHSCTVGGLDGDGILAYLGDPIPRADAPEIAVRMAREVATVLDRLVGSWTANEIELGYGIGLAFGPATLGVMGFEGLYDYTAVGAVVNLASRLCADAEHGEIVVDASFKAAANLDGELRPRSDVDLKGFGVTETFLVEH